MNENDALRLRIMTLREEKGYSQSAFAEKLGLSRSHMNKLENGTLQVSVPYLKQISRVLNIPITQLLEEEEEMKMEQMPFYFEETNKAIAEYEEEGMWTMPAEDLFVTEEKLRIWKENAGAGSVIVGAVACRYLIIMTNTKPNPDRHGYVLPTYGFVNIDHAGWELCEPRFDSTDELIEWFASAHENPIVDVIPRSLMERTLLAEEYV